MITEKKDDNTTSCSPIVEDKKIEKIIKKSIGTKLKLEPSPSPHKGFSTKIEISSCIDIPKTLKIPENRRENRSLTENSHMKGVDLTAKIDTALFIKPIRQRKVGSDYKIGQVLGQGAYGKVVLVKHRQTDALRAMKSMKKKMFKNLKISSLIEEVELLTKLDHPNIVKVFGLYEDDTHYRIITEFCSGGELFEKIQNEDFFSERKAAKYMKEILSALSYLHGKGVVHRDIKAENVLFESRNNNSALKLIDFGVSTKFKDSQSEKMKDTLGTPYYIAPEVLKGSYDNKCDVWSCGVLLYILLCGYPPFNGNRDEQILDNVHKGNFKFNGKRIMIFYLFYKN